MKKHVLFTVVLLAAALLGGAGCNGNTSETETPLPVLENAGQVTLAGGRNRIVCRWTGMAAGGRVDPAPGSATTGPRTIFRPATATAKRS